MDKLPVYGYSESVTLGRAIQRTLVARGEIHNLWKTERGNDDAYPPSPVVARSRPETIADTVSSQERHALFVFQFAPVQKVMNLFIVGKSCPISLRETNFLRHDRTQHVPASSVELATQRMFNWTTIQSPSSVQIRKAQMPYDGL